jgi:hypothetical protein
MGLLDRLLRRTIAAPASAPSNVVGPFDGSFDEWVTAIDAKFRPIVRRGGVKVAEVDVGALAVLDLRELPSTRTRVKGSANWVTEAGRAEFGATEYLLVRQPSNPADPSAVAVVGGGRVVGYLSATKASSFSDTFDPLPIRYDAYLVGGASVFEYSMKLWVDVPALPGLRALANRLAAEYRK